MQHLFFEQTFLVSLFFLPDSCDIHFNLLRSNLYIIMTPHQIPQISQQSQVNTDSIFYVHPSEGSNSVTVTPLLNWFELLGLEQIYATCSWCEEQTRLHQWINTYT